MSRLTSSILFMFGLKINCILQARSSSRSLSVSSASSESVRRERRRHKAAKAAAEELNKLNKNNDNNDSNNTTNTGGAGTGGGFGGTITHQTLIKDRINDDVNFNLSGKLLEDTNTVNGVVVRYSQPEEARKPKTKWRLYVFKGKRRIAYFVCTSALKAEVFCVGRRAKRADRLTDLKFELGFES